MNLGKIILKRCRKGLETLTFLKSRILEYVPNYINKSNKLEEFELKIKLVKPQNCS